MGKLIILISSYLALGSFLFQNTQIGGPLYWPQIRDIVERFFACDRKSSGACDRSPYKVQLPKNFSFSKKGTSIRYNGSKVWVFQERAAYKVQWVETACTLERAPTVVVVKFSLQKLSQYFYVFFSHPFKTVLLLSVTMAKVTNRLIVAALTKSELHLWDSTMCPVLTMFLNQYWGVWIPENTLLLVCLVWAIFNLVNFLCDTYKQIATHLNIKILTI